VLPMSEIYQSRTEIRTSGEQDRSLQMREEAGVEAQIKSEAQASGKGRTRKAKHDDQGHKKRDPNLDNQAVKMYRDIIHLQANYLQRQEIALVVTNERLWECVLTEWMLAGCNPKNVLGMLRQYELMNGGRQL
jgi:hypothetical protein